MQQATYFQHSRTCDNTRLGILTYFSKADLFLTRVTSSLATPSGQHATWLDMPVLSKAKYQVKAQESHYEIQNCSNKNLRERHSHVIDDFSD